MLEIKLFEVRDRATCLIALCTKLAAFDFKTESETYAREKWMLRRSGFGTRGDDSDMVLYTELSAYRSHYDPWSWGDRTHHAAHAYILEHWDELVSGAVIDVEHILGESTAPKVTEEIRV